MRDMESRICKRLVLLAVLGPFIFGPLGSALWGPEGAVAGVLLPVLVTVPLGVLAGTVLAVVNHVAQRRELRANLASPTACRTMSKPGLAAPVSAAVLFIGSAPFLLLATALADGAGPEVRSWVPVAVPLVIALVCQWAGMQRLGDFLLARQAWRQCRPPASPQK